MEEMSSNNLYFTLIAIILVLALLYFLIAYSQFKKERVLKFFGSFHPELL